MGMYRLPRFCITCLYLVGLAWFFNNKAAETGGIDQQLANKVIINNISGYPIEVKTSDPRYSFRLADKEYKPIGNLSFEEVLGKRLVITEFGHSGNWQAKGEKRGIIQLSELIEKALAAKKNEPGNAFFVMILPPAPYGATRQYSDWTGTYTAYFTTPSYAVGKQLLPKSGDPYDIQEFKTVKDLISTRPGATLAGYYSSVDAFKKADKVRWARLVLGLTQDYTKPMATTAYRTLYLKYHPDKNLTATADEKELLKEVILIIQEAIKVIGEAK